jgi:hypothetical protein
VDILVTFHSFWRYAVLIAAIVGLVGALGGWLGSLPPRQTARKAGLVYIIAIDVQALVGIVLWIAEQRWAIEAVDPYSRFIRAEHPAMMILAVIVAHVGQVLSRRAKTDKGAARAVAIAIAISLVLVIVGIPGVVRGG